MKVMMCGNLPKSESDYIAAQKSCGIRKGHFVMVKESADHYANGWDNVWTNDMTMTVGKHFVVREVCDGAGVMLSNGLKYPFFVLSPVCVIMSEV